MFISRKIYESRSPNYDVTSEIDRLRLFPPYDYRSPAVVLL